MGMFEAPKYLTGPTDEAFAQPGDVFWLHNARLDGTVNINGKERDQAKLQVSRTIDGERESVYTAGAGIVNQVRRMTPNDRAALPLEVRLDQVPSKHQTPTNVLSPSSAAVPDRAPSDEADF